MLSSVIDYRFPRKGAKGRCVHVAVQTVATRRLSPRLRPRIAPALAVLLAVLGMLGVLWQAFSEGFGEKGNVPTFILVTLNGLTLAGLPEFRTRNTGLVGLKRNYGVTNAKFIPLAGISPYAALDSGKALAAAVFSTDPPLGKNSKYTVLADPKHVTGFQNVVPIVKTSVARAAGPTFTKTVNAVSAKLTQDAIVAMNKAVIVDKQLPSAVARAFLKANGLA